MKPERYIDNQEHRSITYLPKEKQLLINIELTNCWVEECCESSNTLSVS